MKSRFNTFIEFPDYTTSELEQILISICKSNDYVLDERLFDAARNYLNNCVEQKDNNFSNGRLVRNLYDDLIMNHAKRVVNISNPTKYDLSVILAEDFKASTNKVD